MVIITSNKEKGNLPAPFLRRCVYYYVEFPSDEQLSEIVEVHYRMRQESSPSSTLLGNAIQRFLDVRKDSGLHKMPGTSEFLDWLRALHRFEPPVPGKAALLDDGGDLPYRELLFKLRADWQRYAQAT
jgi:MoxR-like ATPase